MKAYAYWFLLFVLSIIVLVLSLTGRLAIGTAIAVLPDDVAVVGK
jgi:hypothetical protein